MYKIYYELDPETGEIKPTEDKIVKIECGDRLIRKVQAEHGAIIHKAKNENGHFVWLLFKYGEELFPHLSAANLTRLMYAATFCDEDGLVMNKQDLKEKMKLNRARWAEFWDEVVSNNILYEKNKVVYVNTEVFSRGNISTDVNYTRLFCEYVQQLYEQCESANTHKQLSYLFKIIPFVNRRTNIVCFNPAEQDERRIKYMRLGDFCETLGYDRKNARRLAKDLLNIRINNELAVGFFVTDMSEDKWIMIVNPRLYFGGKYDTLFQKHRNLFVQEAREYELLLKEKRTDDST